MPHVDPTIEWKSPLDLFCIINKYLKFTVDVCATSCNAKCNKFWTIEDNALEKDWGNHVCWMCPPLNDVSQWVEKAQGASTKGARIVSLLPYSPDSAWFSTCKDNYILLNKRFYISKIPIKLCLVSWGITLDPELVSCL